MDGLLGCLAVGCQMPPKLAPKSSKNRWLGASWGSLGGGFGALGGVLGGSWGLLGGSWGHLGPKRPPRGKKKPKSESFDPLLGAILGPKIEKNRSQERSKRCSFFDHFLDRVLKRFCANLAPTWRPKPSQNGAKLAPKSMQVGVLI